MATNWRFGILMTVVMGALSIPGMHAWAADVEIHTVIDSGKCLDIPYSRTASGTQIELYTCHDGDNQRWNITSRGEIRTRLDNNKCLNVPFSNPANGTKVEVYTCLGGNNQRWNITARGEIRSRLDNNKCLDIPYSNPANGKKIELYTCHGGNNQKFKLTHCGDRPDITNWFESKLGAIGGKLNSRVKEEQDPLLAWTAFYEAFRTGGIADLKNTTELRQWKDCGVFFYGRLVAYDVPGNVLFGMLGQQGFEDRYDRPTNLELFLLAGAGAAQAVSDGRRKRKGVFLDLVFGSRETRTFLTYYDEPCDQSAIQVGLDAASGRGSMKTLVDQANLFDQNRKCN